MFARRAVAAIAIATALASSAAGAQSAADDSLTRAVDRVFAAYTPAAPGCAVAVYRNGSVLFAKGYGLANIEHNAPITPQTPFILGSVTKQFTAAAIALLAEDGRIAMRDDVRKYIPELNDFGTPITIEQLVYHTSGLRDWWELVELADMRHDDGYAARDMMEMAARQRALNFPPGSRHLYSNTGYILMGMIVQRVTGKSLRAFADERMFKPLGMTNTHFQDSYAEPVRGRADAYSPLRAGGYRIDIWNNEIVGQGGLMSTVLDLAKWDENFYTGTVGGAGYLRRMLERGVLNNGTRLTYAFGLEHSSYRGVPIVEHSGGTGGYRTVITRFPAQHTSVVILCNISTAETLILARKVADHVLRDALIGPVPVLRPVATGVAALGPPPPVSAATARRFAGRYESPELQATYEIALHGDKLLLRRPRGLVDTLYVTDSNIVFNDAMTLSFAMGPNGPNGFVLDGNRVEGILFVKK